MASCDRGFVHTEILYIPKFWAHQFKVPLHRICSFMESSQFGLVQLMTSARHTYANQSIPIQGVVADAPSSNYSGVYGQAVGNECVVAGIRNPGNQRI